MDILLYWINFSTMFQNQCDFDDVFKFARDFWQRRQENHCSEARANWGMIEDFVDKNYPKSIIEIKKKVSKCIQE